MLDETNAEKCRVCEGYFPHSDLKDNPVGRTGICFQCLLIEYRKLKLLLRIKNHGKKKRKLRKG